MTDSASANQCGLLGHILAEALRADTGRLEPDFIDPQLTAASALASDVASITGLTFGVVFDQLTRVPDAMLDLLASPEGWSNLASYLGAHFGTAPIHYLPTRH